MVYRTILEAVGNTPLIQLQRMTEPDSARILVKWEGQNVGGSIKTRTALAMIEDAEQRGRLRMDSILVEATSGNQGIGLALVGAVKGYSVRILMPDSVSVERRKLLQQYGAELILIPDRGNIGEAMERCLQKAEQMAAEDDRVFLPRQFENPINPLIHAQTTAQEIQEQVKGPIHGFCSGFGSGGTLSGIGQALKAANPQMEVWALEPEKASLLTEEEHCAIESHLQMGIGDGFLPANLDRAVYDRCIRVRDEDALATARALAKQEGLLCGISSGSNVFAALQLAKKLGKGKTVVTVLPDTGERYLSTPLFSCVDPIG